MLPNEIMKYCMVYIYAYVLLCTILSIIVIIIGMNYKNKYNNYRKIDIQISNVIEEKNQNKIYFTYKIGDKNYSKNILLNKEQGYSGLNIYCNKNKEEEIELYIEKYNIIANILISIGAFLMIFTGILLVYRKSNMMCKLILLLKK